MVKTLKDFILDGGIKGKFFECKEEFYEVRDILIENYTLKIKVVFQKKSDDYPRIWEDVINVCIHLDDKLYRP